MENVDSVLGKIRNLSSEKDQLTKQLSAENNNLRSLVDTVTAERDAFIVENEAVIQLLMEHGVHQSLTSTQRAATLKSSVQRLMTEREEQRVTVSELRAKNSHLVRDNAQMTQENRQLIEYRARVKDLETEVEDLRKLVADNKKRKDSINTDRKALQARVLIKINDDASLNF